MIGRDCRCPGCGTCGAADEAERLRRLSDSKNAQRIAAEHRAMAAERERDEARAALARTDRARRDSENAWEEEYDAMKRERDEARADFDSLEDAAAKVVLAYRNGDKIELDEAVESLASNGRPQWWENAKPIGLRGESDD